MRKLTTSWFFTIVLALATAIAIAQGPGGYPERPVNLVVPFGIGSGDAQARSFANIAESYLGTTIVASNHPGGNSAIGINYALGQPADGYTIMFLSGSFPLLVAQGALPFTIDDVQPLVAFNADYVVIAVRSDSPFETFDDLAEHARANPGALNVGGTVLRGTHHIFAELVMSGADISMNYIPYEGANDSLVALLGGTIDVMATAPSTIRQYIEEGEIRLLGVSTRDRVAAYPDVPTFFEMGMEQIDDYLNYRGFYTHPDTPREIVEYLSEVFGEAARSQAWLDYLEREQQIDFYRDYAGLEVHVRQYYESIQSILTSLED